MTPTPSTSFETSAIDMVADDSDVISVYSLDNGDNPFEPAVVWAKEQKNHYTAALRLIVDDRTTSPQERGVAQALLDQDSDGVWTGLPHDDRDDYAVDVSSESITQFMHMHAYTTFENRDVIASCLVVMRLMDLGLTVHIYTAWAKLLAQHLLLEVQKALSERKTYLTADDVDSLHRIRAWTSLPLELGAWGDKAAKRMIRDPYSVLPTREVLQVLNRRDLRSRAGFQVDIEALVGYLTRLVSLD